MSTATTAEVTCPACDGTGEIQARHGFNHCETCHGSGTMRCLDGHEGQTPCKGAVELRWPLSGTGRSFPRCDAHWDARLKVQEGINRRYPRHAPSSFDPGYAGESWDED